MADRNGTLAASTVAEVVIQAREIEVVNRDGDDEIWVSVGQADDPTVADLDPDVKVVPAVAGAARVFRFDQVASRTVKLISAGTPTYSVSPT